MRRSRDRRPPARRGHLSPADRARPRRGCRAAPAAGRRLHRVHRGVYAVGHRRLTGHGRWMAAVLACGPMEPAEPSMRAAAAWPAALFRSRIDVTATSRTGAPGIVVHRVRRLPDDDRALVDGIPVTSVARTLWILRGVVRTGPAAARDRRGRAAAACSTCVPSSARRMPRALRDALADYHDLGFTRSEFERRFARLCRDGGLPPPAMNIWIGDQEVDAVWEDEKVAVLLDSWEFHRTRAAFEDDRRRRQAALRAPRLPGAAAHPPAVRGRARRRRCKDVTYTASAQVAGAFSRSTARSRARQLEQLRHRRLDVLAELVQVGHRVVVAHQPDRDVARCSS